MQRIILFSLSLVLWMQFLHRGSWCTKASQYPDPLWVPEPTPIGVVASANPNCSFVISVNEIIHSCPSEIRSMSSAAVDGKSILRFANRVDTFIGSLFFVAALPSEPSGYGALFSYTPYPNNEVVDLGFNVTISSIGTLGNDLMLDPASTGFYFIGSPSGSDNNYGLWRISTLNEQRLLNGSSPPPYGVATNPFFVLANNTLYYRGFLGRNAAIFTHNITSASTSAYDVTPIFSDVDVIGPVRTTIQEAVAFFVRKDNAEWMVCYFTSPLSPMCDPPVLENRNFWANFVAIVGFQDKAYVATNFSIVRNDRVSHVFSEQILSVFHDGDPHQSAYLMVVNDNRQGMLKMSYNCTGFTVPPTGIRFSRFSSAVGGNLYASFVDSSGTQVTYAALNSSITPTYTNNFCPGLENGAPLLPANVLATRLSNGNISIVTTNSFGTQILEYEAESRTFISGRRVRTLALLDGANTGQPTSVSFYKKISDDVFLLNANVLHLQSNRPASIVAYRDFSTFRHYYISNSTTCSPGPFTITHMVINSTNAYFATRDHLSPDYLRLWYVDFERLDTSVVAIADGAQQYWLNHTDLGISDRLPILFDRESSLGVMFARNLNGQGNILILRQGQLVDGRGIIGPRSEEEEAHVVVGELSRRIYVSSTNGTVSYSFVEGAFEDSVTSCSNCPGLALPTSPESIIFIEPIRGELILIQAGVRIANISMGGSLAPDVRSLWRISPDEFLVVVNDESSSTSLVKWQLLFTPSLSFINTPLTLYDRRLATMSICDSVRSVGVIIRVKRSTGFTSFILVDYNTQLEFGLAEVDSRSPTFCTVSPENSLAIINTDTEVYVVDFSTTPASSLVYTTTGHVITSAVDVIRINDSLRLIASSNPENIYGVDSQSVVTLGTVCTDNLDCSDGARCQNRICVAPSPPSLVTSPVASPISQIPTQSPAQLAPVTCSGFPPVVGATCVGTVWIVQGPVNVTGGIVTFSTNTNINGSLVITGSTSTIILGSGVSIDVADCAQFNGLLIANVSIPQSASSSVVNSTVQLVSFKGYCNGVPTKFQSVSLQPDVFESCAKLTQDPEVQYTDRSISVLYSYDRTGCLSSALQISPGAIAGIVVGICALIAIVAIILVLKFKGIVSPFSERPGNPEKATIEEDL